MHFSRQQARILIAVALSAAALCVSACRGAGSSSPYEPTHSDARDPLKAQSLTLEATKVSDKHPEQAEKLLKEALAADLYHGPAHNNLGVIYLKRGDLYAAAGEFEWARKLLPGHPDPRLNLALTLEKAGRVDEALAAYAAALEVYPEHLASMEGLVKLQLSSRKTDEKTGHMLDEIALRGESPEWREWAKIQRTRTER